MELLSGVPCVETKREAGLTARAAMRAAPKDRAMATMVDGVGGERGDAKEMGCVSNGWLGGRRGREGAR
jgi:hypothetical protein